MALLEIPPLPKVVAGRTPDDAYWQAMISPKKVSLVLMKSNQVVASASTKINVADDDEPAAKRARIVDELRGLCLVITEWVKLGTEVHLATGAQVCLETIELESDP